MDNLNAVRNRLPNIMDVQKLLAKRLIGTTFGRNVIGVGIGNKLISFETESGAKKVIDTEVPAVRVYVSQKKEPDEIGSGLTLPRELLQVPVDVIKVGSDFRVQPGFGPRRYPAARPGPGASIGPAIKVANSPHINPVLAGSLGAVVKDGNGKRYILSCNHVLSSNGRIPKDADITFPASVDVFDGKGTTIAKLSHWVPLERDKDNLADCALAEIIGGEVDHRFPDGYTVTGRRAPRLGDRVVHFGKATGLRVVGKIVDIAATVEVEYSFGSFVFSNQILIESDGPDGVPGNEPPPPYATDGDSGALVVTHRSDGKNAEAIGLLFAPAGRLTVACPIDTVLAQLEGETKLELEGLSVPSSPEGMTDSPPSEGRCPVCRATYYLTANFVSPLSKQS